MANEDHDGAAASTGPGDGSTASRSGSSLRTSLDEAKLRLDSPLFKRDAGMSAGEMPKLRELTWDHVVNPTSQVPTVASESAAAGSPGAGAALLERLQDGAEGARLRARALPEEQIVEAPRVEFEPVAYEPDASVETVPDPVDEPVPATIEALLARPSVTGPQVEQIGGSDPVVDVVSAPSWSTEPDTGPSVNDLVALVRQDSPRIPRAAESVSDLADLLRRPEQPTPAFVERHAEPVSEPVSVPAVEPVVAPLVEPVVEPVVAPLVEPVVTPVVTAPTLPQSPPAPTIATSSVQAELDRLAYVPDREEPAGPISIPTIAVGTPPAHPPAPPVPSLSQSGVFAPRVSGAPVAKPSYVEAVAPTQVVVKKRKRHVVRKLFTLLIVLGLIGAGVYAVKRYVLDAVKWSGDAGTLAADVELERGLKFAMPVAVTELPVDEYASNVATLALGVTDDNSDSIASELRALGLLSGTLDLRAIGMSALGDSPAYYDSSSETIFVVAGLPEDLRQFAMHRALALALLDQEFGWGERSQTASPSQARGIRAVYDGDALETATAMVDLADRATVIKQIFGLYATYDIPTTPSPFASTIIGRLGLTTAPYFSGLADDDRAIAADVIPTDGEALDLRRLLDGTAETPSAASRGMLYWYHVLAARVDNDLAWRVALSWKDDDVKVAPGPSGACVTAVVGVDALAVAAAQEAFQAWAAAAPATTPASVVVSDVVSAEDTAAGIREITISACDPGPSVQTNDGRLRLSLGGAPLRAAQYEQLARSQPGLAPQQIACTVFGLDAVAAPADERGIMDPVEGWPALAAHPEPDPATSGCLPA